MDNLADVYDRIAEEWHKDHQSDDWWLEGTDTFAAMMPPGGSVLDIGCGGGVKSKYLAEKGFRVTGVDISKNLLAIADRTAPEASFKELSMYDLDQLPETYDGTFAQASLLHIPKADAPAVVAGMVRRLNPGGIAYIAVKESRPGTPDEKVETEDDYGYPYSRFFSYFTLEELTQYLADAGAPVVWESRLPMGKTVWLQAIGKKGMLADTRGGV